MKNIVSLFNGMSVAEMVFKDTLGDGEYTLKYSEVDKHTNKVTQTLFPDSEPLGDVRSILPETLNHVDYLVGGSPCQSFSFSGKQEGMITETKEEITTLEHYIKLKEKGFKFKGQSYLFWEFVRVLEGLRQVNPDIKFLLENVVMSKKWEKVITDTLGVEPILIDSSLVSGQQRKRLYWTNIDQGKTSQPCDRGVDFREILEDFTGNSAAIRGRYESDLINQGTIVGRRLDNRGKRVDEDKSKPIIQCIEVRKSNPMKTNCLTTVQKDNVITHLPIGRHPHAFDSYTKDVDWRYLTAREAFRLQTIPEHYIDEILTVVSENQAYKMAGNGWTYEVIKHIISSDKNLR